MDRKRQKLSLGKKDEEKDHLAHRVTSLEQELAKKNEEQEHLVKRIASLEQEVAKKETQIKLKNERQEHLEKRVISLEQQLAEKETQLNLTKEEQERLRQRVMSLEEKLKKKEAQLQVIKEPFNVFPNEVILEIFKHLPQNELGKFARVCRKWNGLTRSSILWQKVNVTFHWRRHKSQNDIFNFFIKRLPCSATSIMLEFLDAAYWVEPLDFQELCVTLQGKCPQLNQLILNQSKLTTTLSSAVYLCSQFLPNVTSLVLSFPEFLDGPAEVQYTGSSKITVLAVPGLFDIKHLSKTLFSRMLCLKELYLKCTHINDSWFKNRISFLNRIEVLDLGHTDAGSRAFQAIKNHGCNLKELYMCWTVLNDYDLIFDSSKFPQLNTICLNHCSDVSYEGVVSLVQSCQSLHNIYVGKYVASSYSEHPFIIANQCKLGIVKNIGCYEQVKRHYLCDYC